jgi:hypothetical protein
MIPTKKQRRMQRDRDLARNEFMSALDARERGVLLDRLNPIATAIHEAAHCLIAEAFGLPIKSVTCFPCRGKNGEPLLGSVEPPDESKIFLPGWLHAIHDVIGDAAEYYYICANEWKLDDAIISGTDCEALMDIFAKMGLSKSDQLGSYARLMQTAFEMVAMFRREVLAIAGALYSQRVLSGEKVRAILTIHNFYRPANHLIWFAGEMGKSANAQSCIQRPRENQQDAEAQPSDLMRECCAI